MIDALFVKCSRIKYSEPTTLPVGGLTEIQAFSPIHFVVLVDVFRKVMQMRKNRGQQIFGKEGKP